MPRLSLKSMRREAVRVAVASALLFGGLVASPAAHAQSIMRQCGAAWKDAKATDTTNGQTWPEFLRACRARLSTAEVAPEPAAPPAHPAKPKPKPAPTFTHVARPAPALTPMAKPPAAPLPPPSPSPSPSVASNVTERRVALVIGNSAYRSVQRLDNPERDAELVGAALRSAGFQDVTVAHDLDRAGMVAALKSFAAKADAADWAIVYYAGHGVEIERANYLVPVDAKFETDRDVPDEAISLDRVESAIDAAHKLKLVVLDACRNNPFLPTMRVTAAQRSIGRGLAAVEPAGASLVVYSAKDGTTAEDGAGANSAFASSFAKRLVQPGVEINKMLRFVRQDVLSTTGSQQPYVYGSLPPDDFFFVPPR